jgi:hypothetical protein
MSKQITQNKPLKVAAPYYGSLNHPAGGLSNLFFLFDVNTSEQRVSHMHVTVWNPKDNIKLGSWLQQSGVHTFICNDIEVCQQQDIQASGIRIEPIKCNDVVEGIKTWLTETGTQFFNQAGQLPA